MTIEEHLETLKEEKIVAIYQHEKRTNSIQDGSLIYLNGVKREGTLQKIFKGGWILIDGSLLNLNFVMEIYETT